jgi:YggT family protein
MTQALYFILKTLAHLYLLLYVLRFWLPLLRVDFHNPIAQAVLRLTSPVIIPIRRFVPALGRIDTATVLVAFAIECLVIYVLLSLRGVTAGFAVVAMTSAVELAILSLNMFFFVVLIRIILSWVAPQSYSPVTAMLNTIAEPILRPFRRLVPPISGLDISPIFAIVLLQAAVIVLQSYKPLPL